MIRRVLGVFAAATLVFVLLEITARVYLFGLAGLDPRRIESLRDFRETEFVRESADPALGFEHVPNADGFFKLVPYRTSSAGLRDREYTREKPPDTFRVVVVGSSFTVPAGVAIEDAYHSLMEEELTAERAPTRYEFLNFAIGAYHPRQTLAMLRDRALAWDPDLILFAVTSLSMPLLSARAAVPDEGHRSSVLPRSHPFWTSFLWKLVLLRTGRIDPEIPHRRARSTRGPSIVDALGALRRETGIPIALVRLEFDAQRSRAGEQPIVDAALAQGLYFFDTRESFVGMDPKRLWIYEMDPHPNAAAHRVFARAVTEFLDEEGLLEPRGDGR